MFLSLWLPIISHGLERKLTLEVMYLKITNITVRVWIQKVFKTIKYEKRYLTIITYAPTFPHATTAKTRLTLLCTKRIKNTPILYLHHVTSRNIKLIIS